MSKSKTRPNAFNGPEEPIRIAKAYGFEPQFTNKRASPWPHSYRKGSRYIVPCFLDDERQAGWKSCDLSGSEFVNPQYHIDFPDALERS